MLTQRSRQRISGGFTPGPGWTFSNYAGSSGSGPSPRVGGKITTNDVVTKDYAKHVADGLIIMNPYDSWSQDVSSGHISGLHSYNTLGGPGQWSRTTGNHADLSCGWGVDPPTAPIGISGVLSTYDVSALITEVSTRCLSQISRTTDADNWENIAEISRTYQMLRSPIDNFWSFDRRFWQSGLSKVVQGTLSASKAWLMYRYGLKPLIESARGTLESLKKQKPARVTTRAKGVISGSGTISGSAVSGSFTAYYSSLITATVQVRAMSLDEVTIGDWPWALGLSTKSLLTLPWELVPYSFVADWFVNVGDFYGAIINNLQPQSLGRSLVYKEVISMYRETTSNTSPGSTIVVPMKDWVRVDDVYTKRQPHLAAPGMVIKSNFRLDNMTRVSDALALIGLRVRNFPKLYKKYAYDRNLENLVYEDGSTA